MEQAGGFVRSFIPFFHQKRLQVRTKRGSLRGFVRILDHATPQKRLKVRTKQGYLLGFVRIFEPRHPRETAETRPESAKMSNPGGISAQTRWATITASFFT